jgi:hypothetical protein
LICHTETRTEAEGVENRVLRKIVGTKRDKVTGEWRKFHYEGLYYVYCLPNIIWVKSSQGI